MHGPKLTLPHSTTSVPPGLFKKETCTARGSREGGPPRPPSLTPGAKRPTPATASSRSWCALWEPRGLPVPPTSSAAVPSPDGPGVQPGPALYSPTCLGPPNLLVPTATPEPSSGDLFVQPRSMLTNHRGLAPQGLLVPTVTPSAPPAVPPMKHTSMLSHPRCPGPQGLLVPTAAPPPSSDALFLQPGAMLCNPSWFVPRVWLVPTATTARSPADQPTQPRAMLCYQSCSGPLHHTELATIAVLLRAGLPQQHDAGVSHLHQLFS